MVDGCGSCSCCSLYSSRVLILLSSLCIVFTIWVVLLCFNVKPRPRFSVFCVVLLMLTFDKLTYCGVVLRMNLLLRLLLFIRCWS
jgi:hypothetical protein